MVRYPGERTMGEPSSMKRQRERIGEVSREYGDQLISTLRHTFGPYFAPACDPRARLHDCLYELDEPSLAQLTGSIFSGDH
jgi:hypothetical protein